MAKRRKLILRRPKTTRSANQVPGTMTYVGNKEATETKLEVIDFNAENYERYSSTTPEDAFKFVDEKSITWFNIDGLSNIKEIEKQKK